MWFQAGNRVQQDDKGNVAAWGDNSDLCDPKNTEQKAEDAWQVSPSKRPQWVAKAIGGQPALRFDGFKGLITEPVRLGEQSDHGGGIPRRRRSRPALDPRTEGI